MRFEPICVARRMRCPSPPESVAALRASDEIADPDLVEEAQPLADLLEDAAGDRRFALVEGHRLEDLQGLAHRQRDVVAHRAALQLHRPALGPEPGAVALGALAQRPVGVELGLHRPDAFLEAAAQVGDDALEVLAVGLDALAPRRLRGRRPAPRRARVPRPRDRRAAGRAASSAACRTASAGRCPSARRWRRWPPAPASCRRGPTGAMAPSSSDLDVVGHDLPGVEVPGGAQSLAGRAGAVRRVEGEGARRHLGHADAAVDAGELAREQAVAAVERVDDDDAVGQVERRLDRLGQPALDARAHDQPVDHDVDGVVLPAVERQVVVEALELAVDARLGEAAGGDRLQLLLELALAARGRSAPAR